MKTRIGIVALVMSLFSITAHAQQDAQYTNYMYNTMTVNSAYAGSRGGLSAFLLHRSQWVGLEGAPTTQAFSIHKAVGQQRKIGLGLSVINDKIGPTSETNVNANFSYAIETGIEGRLAFGVNAGGQLLDIAFSDLTQYNPGDILLQSNIDNRFSPNVGAGIYYNKGEKFYVGLSVPNMLETTHFEGTTLSAAKDKMHYNFMGGYVFDLNDNLKFKPAFLTKVVAGSPLQIDLSGNFLINEKLTLGAAYRWDAAFSGLLGYQISDNLMLGFGYDREITDLGKTQFNNGSFEFFLRYEVSELTRIFSPRFF